MHSVILALLPVAGLLAQTQVDLRTQGKSVDFAAAPSTRPVKTGTTIPATCAVGELFFKSDAAAGQNLYSCHTLNTWNAVAGSTQTSKLLDLAVTRVNGTTLLIGGSCSSANPCNVRIGNVTHSITSAAQVTLTSGNGKALIYLASNGALTVGHNLTLSCNSGCVAVSGVLDFPADALPIASWTATVNTWDTIGLLDFRSFQSMKLIVASTGLLASESGGVTTVEVDRAVVGIRMAPPASASAACVAGAWAADSGYVYFCHAANTWKRAALASW